MNLFRDGAKKRLSANLPSTGFSPAKKKGDRRRWGAAISPRDIDALAAEEFDDDFEDGEYSPSPAYKASCTTTQQPRRKDIKIILDSSYFFFLQPLTSDKHRFCRGHPQVYSTADIVTFDTNYQRQLSFYFSATRASRKKSAVMDNPRASRLRDVDLGITPLSFSRDTTDRRELSRYVLEDLLSCPVGCCIIVCVRSGAHGNPTEKSYSDQAKSIASSRNGQGITTELWRMSGEMYHVLQGTICRSTLREEVTSKNLSKSRFLKYFNNRSGDFGISFDGTRQVLSVPWRDMIEYSNIVMFLASNLITSDRGGRCFGSSQILSMRAMSPPKVLIHCSFLFPAFLLG